VGQHDRRAVLGEAAGHRQAEALGAAGDQRGAAGEIEEGGDAGSHGCRPSGIGEAVMGGREAPPGPVRPGPEAPAQASSAARAFLPTRGCSTFSAKVMRRARPKRGTKAQTTPTVPPQRRTTATTAEPRKVAPPAAAVYTAIAAPECFGARAGVMAAGGTKRD